MNARISIDTVFVGDLNNSADTTGLGSVDYGYHIGTYEITNTQYVAFLNAKGATNPHEIYNISMTNSSIGGINRSGSSGSYTYTVKSGFENKPVNFVSFWSAARFANWLTNGQGTGDTESGVYNLNGVSIPVNTDITRDAAAWSAGGVAIASEDEWYKAAYYSGSDTGADGDGYWLYPTQSNTMSRDQANYDNSDDDMDYIAGVSDVGSFYSHTSYYGTMDQGGNLNEMLDTIRATNQGYRDMRGGNYLGQPDLLGSDQTSFGWIDPHIPHYKAGFRLTSLEAIPEPSRAVALLGSLTLLIALVRRGDRQ